MQIDLELLIELRTTIGTMHPYFYHKTTTESQGIVSDCMWKANTPEGVWISTYWNSKYINKDILIYDRYKRIC